MNNKAGKRGAFIVLEGPDGVGKTTAVRGLAERIQAEYGCEVVCLREPGGTRLGEIVRTYLKEEGGADGLVDLLLFSAARRKLLLDQVTPALEAGKVVLSDRFVLSTYAYQGGGLGVEDATIDAVSSLVLSGLKPDVTLLLHLDQDEWDRRIEQRAEGRDRYEQKAFLATVRDRYMELASRMDDVRLVSAAGTPAQVVERLLAAVAPLLPEPIIRPRSAVRC